MKKTGLKIGRNFDKEQLPRLTRRALGIAKVEGDIDYKQIVSDAIVEKYSFDKEER